MLRRQSSQLSRPRQSSENKCGPEGAITTAHSKEGVLTTAIDALSAADILAGLPKRISKVIAPHIADRPSDPALVEADRSWSYREFGGAVAAVVEDLVRLQIQSGDRVLLASENSVALAALIFACSELDAWPVVVNPRLSPRELDQIYVHSGARRIFITTESSKEAAAHAVRLGAELHRIGPLSGVGVSALNETTEPEPVEVDRARQVAALMYTSGTTGQPKGVMLSHRGMLFAASASVLLRGTAPGDRVYAVLPMSHVVGFSILLVATLMAGATAHVVPKYDPAALVKSIAEDGITDLFGVPATYQRLLEFKAVSGLTRLERGQLRRILVAGAPLDLNLKARVEEEFDQPLLNNYGITECSPSLTGVRLDSPRNDESVGKFLPGIEHRLVNSRGVAVRPGEVGELHVRGPNVMLGYYRAPELTAKAIDAEGWFNTGDLARLEDDHLFIVGRSKELIIRSGFNVYPAEVEAVLNAHELVVQSAVIGRPVNGNEEVVAFVQLLPGATIEPAELMRYAATQLTSYKRPCEIVILEALPAASTGKVLKHQLWEAAQAAQARVALLPKQVQTVA
jgi:acyl-CoA synthetase (AMP-forming)/AMP-acid ligase II